MHRAVLIAHAGPVAVHIVNERGDEGMELVLKERRRMNPPQAEECGAGLSAIALAKVDGSCIVRDVLIVKD